MVNQRHGHRSNSTKYFSSMRLYLSTTLNSINFWFLLVLGITSWLILCSSNANTNNNNMQQRYQEYENILRSSMIRRNFIVRYLEYISVVSMGGLVMFMATFTCFYIVINVFLRRMKSVILMEAVGSIQRVRQAEIDKLTEQNTELLDTLIKYKKQNTILINNHRSKYNSELIQDRYNKIDEQLDVNILYNKTKRTKKTRVQALSEVPQLDVQKIPKEHKPATTAASNPTDFQNEVNKYNSFKLKKLGSYVPTDNGYIHIVSTPELETIKTIPLPYNVTKET